MKTKHSLWLSFGLIMIFMLAGLLLLWHTQLNTNKDLTAQLKKPKVSVNFNGIYTGINQQENGFGKMKTAKNYVMEIQGPANEMTATVYGAAWIPGNGGLFRGYANGDILSLTGYANGQILSRIGESQDGDDPEVAYRTELNGTGYDEDGDGAADMIDFEGTVTLLRNGAPVDQEVIKFTTYRK